MRMLYIHKFFSWKNFRLYHGECQTEEIVTDKDWKTFLSKQRDSHLLVCLSTKQIHVKEE